MEARIAKSPGQIQVASQLIFKASGKAHPNQSIAESQVPDHTGKACFDPDMRMSAAWADGSIAKPTLDQYPLVAIVCLDVV